IQGTHYLRPLHNLLTHVTQSQLLAHDYVRGNPLRRPELIQKQGEIDADFAALTPIDQELGAGLKTTRKYETLKENWRFLKEKLLSLEPRDSDGLHAQLLTEIRSLITWVGDTSNLILDPNLDSYYLTDVLLLKLPAEQDFAGRASLLGKKTLGRVKTL